MPYTPDATDVANPADVGIKATTAPWEFRTLKIYLASLISGSTAFAALKVTGETLIGTVTSYRAGKLVVKAPSVTSASSTANFHVTSSTPQAADLGGSMALGGYVDAATTDVPFAYLAGRKENSTAGQVGGYLQISVSSGSGAVLDAARISSSGNLLINTTTDYRGGKLVVKAPSLSAASTTANMHISSTDNQGTGLGGSLAFGGFVDVGVTESPFAYIAGRKENAISGNYAGYLSIHTTSASAATNEVLRVTSTGGLIYIPLAAAPASPLEGTVYYDSVLKKLRVFTTVWENLN